MDCERILVNSRGLEDQTPLHMACRRNALADVETLIAAGADVNAKDSFGMTPLYAAVLTRNLAMVKTLVESGAEVDIQTADGVSPLDFARDIGEDPIARYLTAKLPK